MKVTLPFSQKTTELDPCVKGTFRISGAAEFPPAKVQVGKVKAEAFDAWVDVQQMLAPHAGATQNSQTN